MAFNERTVLDTNGCDNPRVRPAGMPHVLENGAFVVGNGVMTGTGPGRAIREWPSRGGFRKAEPRRVGSQKGFPIRALRIVGSRRHGVLTFPGLEPVLQQAGDPMRTVLVKNGIIVDSGALRALGILIAGDRAPHGTPGVETPFGVTWDEGHQQGAHRRHGFRQEHEPESGEKHSDFTRKKELCGPVPTPIWFLSLRDGPGPYPSAIPISRWVPASLWADTASAVP